MRMVDPSKFIQRGPVVVTLKKTERDIRGHTAQRTPVLQPYITSRFLSCVLKPEPSDLTASARTPVTAAAHESRSGVPHLIRQRGGFLDGHSLGGGTGENGIFYNTDLL